MINTQATFIYNIFLRFLSFELILVLQNAGTSLADIWERSLTIDAITKLFEELDINKEGLCLPHNRETALILYKKSYEEQKAIVKYSKKQKPKVQLDPETSRVWKLLMSSIDCDGVDGSDEEKRKWWEEERNMFHGRANSFIARMRVVQGIIYCFSYDIVVWLYTLDLSFFLFCIQSNMVLNQAYHCRQ